MKPEMKKFWMGIISSKDTNSSKRLITLIIALHFIIASFVILFFAFYLIVYTPKGAVNIDLLNLLKNVLEYDFYIILAGLGFITSENLAQILIERAKAIAGLGATTTTPVDTTKTTSTETPPVDPNNVPQN